MRPIRSAGSGDSVAALLDVARNLDQKIYLESHPQTSIPTAEKIAAFTDNFNDPRLLVAYDVASAEFIGEDQVKALRLLGRRVGQTHLSDSTRTAWRHDSIAARHACDFAPILSTIDAIGFTGVNILEIISANPLDDIARSHDGTQVRGLAGRNPELRPKQPSPAFRSGRIIPISLIILMGPFWRGRVFQPHSVC